VHKPAPLAKNWRILLEQSFTAGMPLLMAIGAFGLGSRRWSSPQQCYLQSCTIPVLLVIAVRERGILPTDNVIRIDKT